MRRSYTKSDVVGASLCAVLIVMTAGAVKEMGTAEAFRQTCATNLSGLGKAMLIYSNDYEDELPMAGGKVNEWVPTIPNWLGRVRTQAFGMSIQRTGDTAYPAGKTTTTSSLYLLVKYAEVHSRHFVCPSEPKTRAFSLSEVKETLPGGFELIDAWDFGGRYDDCNNPSRHCSYSYHASFDHKDSLTLAYDAGMAVLADRNPWIDPNRVNDADLGWARFLEASKGADPNGVRIGNTDAHQREGQNVLFLDTHVAFLTRPTCGVNKDNIYTIDASQSEPGKPRQIAPQVYSPLRPAHKRDSVLVQELPYTLRGTAARSTP
ncbi:MAG TPA: hypothetical protein PKH24_19275 [Sedimentisphaerales bacterium]|jgi:hypothetical protein|nr:hypothetical protein [Sedimentisphaerales bacterium]HNU31211.1 hypothetical protein [Sedimentisphaerales bacterium]